jgi:hypothetical protein
MRKRPSAAVSSTDRHDAVHLANVASACKKKRQKNSTTSVAIPVLSLVILLAGVLLLWFNGTAITVHSLSEEDELAVFLDWFRAAGGNVSDKIAVQTFPGMGRGGSTDVLLVVPTRV